MAVRSESSGWYDPAPARAAAATSEAVDCPPSFCTSAWYGLWRPSASVASMPEPMRRELRDRLGEIPPATAVVVFCAGGYRSSSAASVLSWAGLAAALPYALVGGLVLKFLVRPRSQLALPGLAT